jgi:hypothetical protein
MSLCVDVFHNCQNQSASDARKTCVQYGVPIADGKPGTTCTAAAGATDTTSSSTYSAATATSRSATSASSATSLTSSTTGNRHYNNSISDAPPTNSNNIQIMALIFFFVSILLPL